VVAELAELADFAELTELKELADSYPLTNPHLYTEHDIYGMEYFHWPAWASSPAVLPPSSCTPARQLNMEN